MSAIGRNVVHWIHCFTRNEGAWVLSLVCYIQNDCTSVKEVSVSQFLYYQNRNIKMFYEEKDRVNEETFVFVGKQMESTKHFT